VGLMKNVLGVTDFLRKKIIARGGDPERETLTVIPTLEGQPYYKDSIDCYWRCYGFITGAATYDQVRSSEDFFQSAVAFGRFQQLLSDYDAASLIETIPHFHDTPVRFETFKAAVKDDIMGRAAEVAREIDFVMAREADMAANQSRLAAGELPLRVTHNDTKLNNVMLDDETGKGICVIDLDTVMPGLAVNDFGDSIRFGASTAAEDEQDLSRVSMSLDLFEAYTKGFLQGCGGSLTAAEVDAMPMGAKLMTLECGMRFLTDYLQGDTYFRVHRPGHNLDRCRTQFKLVADMEAKWSSMHAICQKESK